MFCGMFFEIIFFSCNPNVVLSSKSLIMKNLKKVLVPISNHCLTFNLIKKRFPTTPSPKNKSGYNYSMQLDSKATKLLLKSIIKELPNREGTLIILASQNSIDYKTIKIISSPTNLKSNFCKEQNFLETYNFYYDLLINNKYTSLKFQLAKTS